MGKFGKALDHIWSGKSNEAINPLSTNVDVNRRMHTRVFSDSALGGQKEMEGVLGAFDKHQNPWKHDQGRLHDVKYQQGKVDEYDDLLKDNTLTDDVRDKLKSAQQSHRQALIDAKKRQSGDPGLWETTGAMTKGTFNAMNAGSAGQVAAKWGAVAGAGLILNGTGRAMTGGGATYNSSGQRDIMGVPFV